MRPPRPKETNIFRPRFIFQSGLQRAAWGNVGHDPKLASQGLPVIIMGASESFEGLNSILDIPPIKRRVSRFHLQVGVRFRKSQFDVLVSLDCYILHSGPPREQKAASPIHVLVQKATMCAFDTA